MKNLRQFAFSVILVVEFGACASTKPFPSDWITYPVAKQEVEAKLEAHWKEILADVQEMAEEDKQKTGIDVLAQFEARVAERRREWSAFIQQMQPGDELGYYSPPPAPICNWNGYAIMRKGRKIATYQ